MTKSRWRSLWRWGRYLVLGLVGVVLLLAIASVWPRQWRPVATVADCEHPVYVSGGWMHTNLFVPVATPTVDWRNWLDLTQVGRHPETFRYLQFGWGDRRFYMETPSWDQVNGWSALRALFFWNNPTAVFVKGHTAVPRYAGETLKCVSLSAADYAAMTRAIQQTFALDAQGQPDWLGLGQDGDSAFFAAHGTYSWFRTCNSWTAAMLRAGNVNTPVWGGLAPSVMRLLGEDCPCSSA